MVEFDVKRALLLDHLPIKRSNFCNLTRCIQVVLSKSTSDYYTEVFLETPSSLKAAAYLWSDYKHHHTFKFLVAVTPNGTVSWISPCYGGCTSDVFIVRDSGFLDLLEPYETVMVDHDFEIKSELTLRRCYLAVLPSAAKGAQMTDSNVSTTSKVANV